MSKTERIESLGDAFTQAILAHHTLADDERLCYVSMGRYNQDLGGRSNLGGSYYWQINAERIRTLQGPSEVRTSITKEKLVATRADEIKKITAAYEEARDRLAAADEGEGV